MTQDAAGANQTPIDLMELRLQPLRIPTGWNVLYNNGLWEIDPLPELVAEDDRWHVFKGDMLHMRQDRFDRLLDLGWSPEGNLTEGQYRLVLYEGDFRGRQLHRFETRDRLSLVHEIERLLAAVCRGEL